MDETRKKIIINEIIHWKESKMLPEQYCDYLLALYTEGNQSTELVKEKKSHKSVRKNVFPLLLIPIFVFLLYFTELSFDLQIALSILLLFLGIIVTFYFFKKGNPFQISLIVSALLCLLLTVEVTSYYFANETGILYTVIVANCLLWIVLGNKLKLLYFQISGVLGIILLIISIFI